MVTFFNLPRAGSKDLVTGVEGEISKISSTENQKGGRLKQENKAPFDLGIDGLGGDLNGSVSRNTQKIYLFLRIRTTEVKGCRT